MNNNEELLSSLESLHKDLVKISDKLAKNMFKGVDIPDLIFGNNFYILTIKDNLNKSYNLILDSAALYREYILNYKALFSVESYRVYEYELQDRISLCKAEMNLAHGHLVKDVVGADKYQELLNNCATARKKLDKAQWDLMKLETVIKSHGGIISDV